MTAAVASVPEIAIEPEAVRRFADVVFGGLSGFVDVRMLAEKGMPEARPRCFSVPVDGRLAAALKRHASDAAAGGLACYVVPATVATRARARALTVVATAVILIDLDDGDIDAKLAHLVAYLGQPSLTVASGGVTEAGTPKLHVYWRLMEPACGDNLRRVRALRDIAARKVGGDPSVARVQQPIRLAGSVHCKHGRRTPVRILEDTDWVHALDALELAVDAMPAILNDDRAEEGEEIGDRRTGPIRAGGVDGTTRFDALSRFIGEQVRRIRLRQASRPEAWKAVTAFNAAMIEPSWEEARLRREFAALELLDRRNHDRTIHDAADTLDRTEHGLARRLADAHAAEWRYATARGSWLEWTGSYWRPDEMFQVLEVCRQLCEHAAAGQSPSERRRLLSDRTIRAVERLARSDPRMAAGAVEWDADGMLLNTPVGVIDLRTGELLPSDPGLQMTRVSNASPGSYCPRWLSFITRITDGDVELAAYLQRVAGYCLTGRTDEQAFFFVHGSGSNGKTVFLETLSDVLGSYARTAPLDCFMATRGDRHPSDLASLDGARMVIATETETGRSWAEARIKAITGGDRIAVRRMYGDFYQATPTYKILIAGNHRPRLTGGGTAMARRLQLIPFGVVIPANERDGDLRGKLADERDGILGWMLDGSRSWQKIGLRAPQKVRDAVSSYFESEDFIGQWIADCCEIGDGLRAPTAELYASWKQRAESLGLEPGSVRELSERLRDRSFQPFRDRAARGWKGLRLLPANAANRMENPR